MTIEIFKNYQIASVRKDHFFFRIRARNGKILAESGGLQREGYRRREAAEEAVELLLKAARESSIKIKHLE